MDAAVAGLIGALVGAALSLLGTLLAGWQQAKLEQQKWLRAQKAQEGQELRVAVAELARKLAGGVHTMQWFTWPAVHESQKLTLEQVDAKLSAYNQEIHGLFPELTGSLMAIAALDRGVYQRMGELVATFIKLDTEIALAATRREEGLAESVEALANCHAQASRYFDRVHESVSAIVEVKKAAREVAEESARADQVMKAGP